MDPHNWPLTERWGITTFMVAFIALVVGIAASIDSAAADSAARDLGMSTEVINLETAVFLIGKL